MLSFGVIYLHSLILAERYGAGGDINVLRTGDACEL